MLLWSRHRSRYLPSVTLYLSVSQREASLGFGVPSWFHCVGHISRVFAEVPVHSCSTDAATGAWAITVGACDAGTAPRAAQAGAEIAGKIVARQMKKTTHVVVLLLTGSKVTTHVLAFPEWPVTKVAIALESTTGIIVPWGFTAMLLGVCFNKYRNWEKCLET